MTTGRGDLVGIARRGPVSDALGAALGWAAPVSVPDLAAPAGDAAWHDAVADWRRQVAGQVRPARGVVVAALEADLVPEPIDEVDPQRWQQSFGRPFVRWFTALQLAADLCADGGSIVVVLDRPSSLDAAGCGATVALAEGIATAARSLAQATGPRGVRVNTVTTPAHTHDPTAALAGSPPPLAGYPGDVATHVAGAVRLLLTPDAAAFTGATFHADLGRSWA